MADERKVLAHSAEQIDEAVEKALDGTVATKTDLQKKADSSSVYTKTESISASTRTALSLPETATPDAALAEIARKLSESGGAIESTEYPGCYYRMVDDVVEWVNPPMIVGIEYRITERYMGLPVYTKIFALGQLPSSKGNMEVNIASSSSEITVVDAYHFAIKSSSGLAGWEIGFPNMTPAGVIYLTAAVSGARIDVYVGQDYSTYYGFSVLKYVKNT